MSNPLKWHGGKTYLASRIISLMPPHTRYVEPYFGGGAVLFAKPCEGVAEFVNDINGELMNFWESLRQCANQMVADLQVTPFSQRRWEYEQRNPYTPIDSPDWRAAVSFVIRYRMSRQGLGKDYCTPTKRLRRGMNENVSAWLSAVDGLPEAHERLQRVEIWNRDAIECIQKLDSPDTLFYCDPPYLHHVRSSTVEYGENEMSMTQHEKLLRTLCEIKGKFQLSGYFTNLYDTYAYNHRWRRVDFDLPNNASSAKKKQRKTECLWMNY